MVKIITDTASDLSYEYLLARPEIEVVSLKTTYKNQNLEKLPKKDFYNILQNLNGEFPKTSMASPDDYLEAFKRNIKDEILCITLGSGYSGTYKSALVAKDLLAEEENVSDIYIHDSLTLSVRQGIIVDIAYEQAKMGKTAQEIIEYLKEAEKHISFSCVLNDLEYLYAGGRLSKTSAKLGTMLNIKPVLTTSDNKIITKDKTRGIKKTVEYLINEINPEKVDKIFIMKGIDTDISKNFFDVCEYPYTIFEVGPVIATHSGPECFGIIVLEKF